MKSLLCLNIFLFSFLSLTAQSKLISGIWEGSLYFRGQEYRMELNLNVKGRGKIKGFSNIHLPNGKTVEMKLDGQLYFDRSMNLYEKEILNEETLEEGEWYKRNYQIVFRRDLWEMDLKGYWQEQVPELADKKSKLGRVILKKKDPTKA